MITGNIAAVGLPGAQVRRGSVATVLAAGTDAPADLVFADPPYEVSAAEVESMLVLLGSAGWVSAGSVVVVERPAAGPPLSWPAGWEAWPQRRYGDTRIEAASC